MTNTPLAAPPKPKPRQLNIEMLRIVSMLLVLFVHYLSFVVKVPYLSRFNSADYATASNLISYSLCIVCVNCFVLISGWFSIRPKVRSFANLIFQILFWIVFCGLVYQLLPYHEEVGMLAFFEKLLRGSWFVWAYIGLYAFAPVFNAYLDKVSVRTLAGFVGIFYLLSTLCGLITTSIADFNYGYSVISLAGLYFLGNLLRRTEEYLPRPALAWLFLFLAMVLMVAGMAYLLMSNKDNKTPFAYNNPLVVIESACLFMCFVRMKIKRWSKYILYVSSSAFAVFLGHSNLSSSYYGVLSLIRKSDFNAIIEAVLIIAFVLAVFACAIWIDKLRIFLFGKWYPAFENRIKGKEQAA